MPPYDEIEKNQITGPSREKYWSEIGIEEKLERSRAVIKQLQWELRDTREDMDRMRTMIQSLIGHGHNADGEVTVLLETAQNGIGGLDRNLNILRGRLNGGKISASPENPNEVYF